MEKDDCSGRIIRLAGAHNLRDIGGYPTTDGHSVKRGSFYRSGSMHELTRAAQMELIKYGVRNVVDLRRKIELKQFPNVFAESSQVNYMHHDLMGGYSLLTVSKVATNSATDTSVAQLVDLYTSILDFRRRQIVDILGVLASLRGSPVVFHCMAGKDRTGILSSLLLSIARVPSEIIVQDYAMNEWLTGDLRPRDAMVGIINHIESSYGDIESYVLDGGLTSENLNLLRCALIDEQ